MAEGRKLTEEDCAIDSLETLKIDITQDADRLNMEGQKQRLIWLIESRFGLLDKLLKYGALTCAIIETIKTKLTLSERNEFLLNYIFSENKHQDLMKALLDCGQHHVVNWVKGNGEYKEEFGFDWPLRETEEKILNDKQETLVDLLSANDVCPKLYSMRAINERQRESIGSKPTGYERNEALLDAVRRFSLKSYFTFKECLRQSGQSHVADILQDVGIIVPIHATLECENVDDVEEQLVNQLTPVQLEQLISQLSSHPKVVAFRRGKSIVIYTSCNREEEFDYLCKIIDNLEMRNILEQLFNQLIPNVKIKVLLVNILSKDIAKAKQLFREKADLTVQISHPTLTTVYLLPLEILDIIIKKSCVLVIQRKNRAHEAENEIPKQLASVSHCWFKRMTKRRFKNSVLSYLSSADRLNMEIQKDRLIELIESEFGLLDKLLRCGALTRVQMAKVKCGRTVFEKNDYLLRYIFSGNKHQDLMKVLLDYGQHHVINWVRGNGEYKEEYGSDWPLKETEVKILDNNQEALADCLRASEILPNLHSKQVINQRQREIIDSEPTEYKKSEALLETVRRLSLKSYTVFIQCIRMSGQSHVADILEYDGAIVPVHARLECEYLEILDKVETRIINQMENVLMRNASMKQANQLLDALELKVIAMRRRKNIVSYISCNNEEEFINLCKIIDNFEMRNILEQLFNLLNPNAKIKVLLAIIMSRDIEKAKKTLKEIKRTSMNTKDKDQGLQYQDKDSEEERWKMTFDRHHDFIIDRMSPDFNLIDKLYSNFAITEDEKDEIKAENDVQKRNKNLIKCMGRKLELGMLIQVLRESGQKHLANYLKDDGRIENEDTVGSWLEEGRALPILNGPSAKKEMIFKVRLATNLHMVDHHQVYPVNLHLTRGRVLIINNQYFLGLELTARYGAQYDGKNLKELFEQLSFTVEIHENQSTMDMKALFEAERKHADHKKASMFILFILSHGGDGYVYGSDGEKLSIEDDITSCFTPEKAPLLLGKPKIFFIHASQGENMGKYYVSDFAEKDKEVYKKLGGLKNEDKTGFISEYFEMADIVMSYATCKGYLAWRHTDFGSWFVRCLVHVFSQRAHSEHLLDMLTEVNSLLTKLKTDDGYGQLANKSDTLTKKLYLFPGPDRWTSCSMSE